MSENNLHSELVFTNARVIAGNLLGEEGEGFAIGQAQLGPERLHHCLRAVGECELLISLMVTSPQSRSTAASVLMSIVSPKRRLLCRA